MMHGFLAAGNTIWDLVDFEAVLLVATSAGCFMSGNQVASLAALTPLTIVRHNCSSPSAALCDIWRREKLISVTTHSHCAAKATGKQS